MKRSAVGAPGLLYRYGQEGGQHDLCKMMASLMLKISKWSRYQKGSNINCGLLLGVKAWAFVSNQIVCCGNYLYAALCLAQCSVKMCLNAPGLVLLCSEEGREAVCLPGLGHVPREGTALGSLLELGKRGMCWVFLFFFSHSLCFELTLPCRMWEVTEVSLWCGVSWMKSVCCLRSALHASWRDCSTGRRDVAAAESGLMCLLRLPWNPEK